MKRRRNSGFTLVELILVLIILSLLAAIVVPRLVGTGKDARIKTAIGQIGMFKSALARYSLYNYDNFPQTQQGLKALVEKPGTPPIPKKWKGPYLDADIPKDPWGNDYLYECPGKHFPKGYDVWCKGPDGQDGTDDDIGNWNLGEDHD